MPARPAGAGNHQWRQRGLRSRHGKRVIEYARQVGKKARLAISIPQPCEYAEHLDVALQSHAIEPAQEFLSIPAGIEAESSRALAIAVEPGEQPRTRPDHVAILQQRHEVIADRPAHCVLKIEDAGIVAWADHEIA